MKFSLNKISIFLILCLTLNFYGCSMASTDGTIDEDAINIMLPLNSISEPEDDSLIASKIEEFTGEKVNFIWIASDAYKEKSTMMIASGVVPDILVVEDESMDIVQGVEEDAFWNITNYLDAYENLSSSNKYISNNASFNGQIYGIYRYKNPLAMNIVLRKDWLQNLGLEVPSTPEEFENVLASFVNNDPDGNGKDDTYALEIAGAEDDEFNTFVDEVAAWFGAENEWTKEDDKLIPSFMTEEYKNALLYIKNLYDQGLIDEKFYQNDTSDVENSIVDGNYGAAVSDEANAIKINDALGMDVLTVINGVKEEGKGKILYGSGYSGLLMFPKAAIADEEKLNRVLSFVDKLNSQAGYTLLNYGAEGENYNLENGVITSIDGANNYDLLSYSELNTNVNEYGDLNIEKSNFAEALEKSSEVAENDRAVDITEFLKLSGNIQNQDYIMEDVETLNAKLVFGQITSEEYDQGLEEWLNDGGQDYIDEVNELYNNA